MKSMMSSAISPLYSTSCILQHLVVIALLLRHVDSDKANSSPQSSSQALASIEQPRFSHDQLTVNISVQRGSTIHLHCKVSGLRDQSVSWYRRKGSEIHLITFGFQTYHNDDRFSLTYDHPQDWRLRIKYVQDRDEGTYECQVSTHPPLIRTVHLHVVVPAISILDDRGVVLSEKFYKSGSTIQLQCVVANVPTASSLQLAWYHGDNRLNYDARRGGVSVKTELRGSTAKSWLRVGDAKIEDSGVYFCNVTELSATSVTIHVVPEKYPAAIQGASTVHSSQRNRIVLLLLASHALCLMVPNYLFNGVYNR